MIPGAVYRRRNANCNGTRGSRCTAGKSPIKSQDFGQYKAIMESVNELLKLFMRQAELERATKRPSGARVIEERELKAVGEKLARVPDAVKQASPAQGNDESEVLLPVTCPVCTQQMLTGFRISVIAAALDTGDIRLYSSCHLASWEASDAELRAIHGYLTLVLGSSSRYYYQARRRLPPS